ncbi:MAG: class I tRNA ligase family protein, partial [Candidatus Marinimicrobia bacterium]|nr:class I tRNA ligase family protein [Candidatus Neomarinimicrobiota bacterium]
MILRYPFKDVEAKWRKRWADSKAHSTAMDKPGKKLYSLTMFSYPSGDNLHIGHWYNYGPADSWSRFKKMQGFDVYHPQGFDAFGLPAENYAIQNGVHPAQSTQSNIATMKRQLGEIGAMYDWESFLDTSHPEYYKWTQWLFLKLYEMGLANREEAPVNWCPKDETVLANEQVRDGRCDRCGTEVVQKILRQWFFKITRYADELLEGLDHLDWPEKTKAMQRNWIGKSTGATIEFPFADESGEVIKVFTTRPDTLYGATYMVLAPEHPLVEKLVQPPQAASVAAYIAKANAQTELDRISQGQAKTGEFTGGYAINPFTKQKVPVWIADYVLYSYGTGAIMAVPASDERDFEFATAFNLP